MKSYGMCVGGAVLALLAWGCDSKQVAEPVGKGPGTPAAAKARRISAPDVESGAPTRPAQTTCPVMAGRKINKSLHVDHNGKRVYFCCPGCPRAFKKDPGKYLKKLAAEGVALEDAPVADEPASPPEPEITQTTCPVTGGGIDTGIYVDYKGTRVYFCCPRCPSAFKKDPEKYMKVLDARDAKPKDTTGAGPAVANKPKVVQTTCPIEGKTINGNIYLEHKGKLVYLCSLDCMQAFEDAPDKYVRKLLAKGVELDDAPISCGGCGPLPDDGGGSD
ncbi:MAG: YHS domain-containing protein [Planctomycetota bacterium]|jgi:YHS domain-containing protein